MLYDCFCIAIGRGPLTNTWEWILQIFFIFRIFRIFRKINSILYKNITKVILETAKWCHEMGLSSLRLYLHSHVTGSTTRHLGMLCQTFSLTFANHRSAYRGPGQTFTPVSPHCRALWGAVEPLSRTQEANPHPGRWLTMGSHWHSFGIFLGT